MRGRMVVAGIAALLGASWAAAEPSVLALTEQDENGKRLAIERSFGTVVDVNSRVGIAIDADGLRRQVLGLAGESERLGELLDKAAALRQMADTGREGLPALGAALAEWGASAKDKPAVDALQAALKGVAQPAVDIAKSKDAELGRRLDAAFERLLLSAEGRVSIVAQYALYFETAADYAAELGRQLDAALEQDGVAVRLGAWLLHQEGERALHLPGFDAYPEGELVRIERWSLALTDGQKQEFERMRQLAGRFETDGAPALLDFARDTGQAILGTVGEPPACLDQVRRTVDAAGERLEDKVRLVETQVERMKDALSSFRQLAANLRARYAQARLQGDPIALIDGLDGDINAARAAAGELVAAAEALVDGLNVLIVEGELRQAVAEAAGEIKDEARSCADAVKGQVRQGLDLLAQSVGVTLGSDRINRGVLEFGEEVFALSLDRVPEETTLDIRRAGARAERDKLLIRLGGAGRQTDFKTLEEHELVLQRSLTHLELVVGAVFADPQAQTAVQRRFQLAPAYNILFKGFGSRSPSLLNVWDPGLGFNIAALDFDKDDTPELGVGLVASFVRDYVQLGYGYNLNDDTPYWFVGLRFPAVPSVTPSSEAGP